MADARRRYPSDNCGADRHDNRRARFVCGRLILQLSGYTISTGILDRICGATAFGVREEAGFGV